MTNKTTARDERIYSNAGNSALLDLLDGPVVRVLDVGCGAGDNTILLKQRYPSVSISGVTVSTSEAAAARPHLDACWVFDIEQVFPPDLQAARFDTLVFSHVLEHLRNPAEVLSRFVKLLDSGGTVLIAVPNVLQWRQRIKFLLGKFEYECAGVMDDTHLRFFTYYTAAHYLLAECPELTITHQSAPGSIPLWWLRRSVLPAAWSDAVDRLGSRHWPNLFGGQVLIKATKS
jgi:2-polyprenyl-3-methyl-5-hydroxy-6-metoxy-1,4-benzoquinol methylase